MTADDAFEQTEAEIRAHIQGVASFALSWLSTILTDFRWDLAMHNATPDLRQGHAEGWVNGAIETGEIEPDEGDEVMAALSEPDVDHRWWDRFALANHRYYTARFGDVRDNLSVGSRPRPTSPGHELVSIADYRSIDSDEASTAVADGTGRFLNKPALPFAWITLQHAPEGLQVAAIDFMEDHSQES